MESDKGKLFYGREGKKEAIESGEVIAAFREVKEGKRENEIPLQVFVGLPYDD